MPEAFPPELVWAALAALALSAVLGLAVSCLEKPKSLDVIAAERAASDKAMALAEEVFAEFKPHVPEEKQAEVIRNVFARIKRFHETRK